LRLCPTANVTVPLTLYVGQVILFKFSVPAGPNKLVPPVRALVQVKLNVAKSIVPEVTVNVVQRTASVAVVVPDVLSIVNVASVVLPLLVIVPVLTNVGNKLVYVPVADNIKVFKFNVALNGVEGELTVLPIVPKSSLLNQLPAWQPIAPIPDPVNVKFGLLVVEPPPEVPKLNDLSIDASLTNPPVPV